MANRIKKGGQVMDEQSKMMIELLKEIRDKISVGTLTTSAAALRGPVADPGPEWGRWPGRWADPSPPWIRGPVADPAPDWSMLAARSYGAAERIANVAGPIADPGPELLLDKARLAKLKIARLEQVLVGLEKQMDAVRLERDLLKQEYKIK
jgi:hypothetical protein